MILSRITAPDAKGHKQFGGFFDNYRGRVGIDNTIFDYIVRVGYGKSNEKLFYDLNLEPIETEDISSKGLRQEPIPYNDNKILMSSVTDSISENEPIVNQSIKENATTESKEHFVKTSLCLNSPKRPVSFYTKRLKFPDGLYFCVEL